MQKTKYIPIIKNKKALFNYEIIESYTAGIQLQGMDVKLIRLGLVGISESYCNFINNELYITGIHLSVHDRKRLVVSRNKTQRKLLIKRKELNKLERKISEKGLSIIPLELFFSENGYVKIEIALAKGKREYDKRNILKKMEAQREILRIKKHRLHK